MKREMSQRNQQQSSHQHQNVHQQHPLQGENTIPIAMDNEKGNNYLRLQQSQIIRSSIQGISQLLNTGLTAETLDICTKLIEAGIHPQALAEVIIQIRNEMETVDKVDDF